MKKRMNYKKALCGLICLNFVILLLLRRLWKHNLRINQKDDRERRSPELKNNGFSLDKKSVITAKGDDSLPKCPHCGRPVSILMDFRFCPGCGNRLRKNNFLGEIPKKDVEKSLDMDGRMMCYAGRDI